MKYNERIKWKTGPVLAVPQKTARTDDIMMRKDQRTTGVTDYTQNKMLLRGLYLREVHAQANLREKMHDDALVLLHRLPLSVIITVIMAIKWV